MFLKEKLDPPIVEIPQPLEPWRQVLLDAAQRLRGRGWCRGTLISKTGAHCILGTIHDYRRNGLEIRASEDPNSTIAAEQFMTVTGIRDLIHWNDAPERTAEEVISTLEKVARS